MNLPKIATPTYELTIPSTKQKVSYRPYVTKEEKLLMMAKESNDTSAIIRATKKLVESCVDGVDDAGKLTTFDYEYIFVKLRSVSSGETPAPKIRCCDLSGVSDTDENACTQQLIIPVNYAELEPTYHEDHQNKIVLSDDGIGVIMKYPTIEMSEKQPENITDTERVYAMIASCIDVIFDSEKTYPTNEVPESEVVEFVESLSSHMIEKINKEFFNTMPSLKYTTTITCPKCGKVHEVTLKGLEDFF